MAKTAETTTAAELSEREALILAVQAKLGGTKTAAEAAIKAVVGSVAENLLANGKTAGHRLPLHGLAVFTVKPTDERKRKNPKTGEMFTIKAGTKIVVKLAKALHEVGK